MRHYFYIIFPLFLFLLFSPMRCLHAAEISVNAQVDKRRITLEDRIQLTISVEGSSSPGDPKITSFEGFDVISSGRSSRIQIVNGRMTSSIDFNYILVPQKKGSFTIPPISLKIKGKKYTTSSIAIEVADSPYREDEEGRKTHKDIFITAQIDDNEPFVNQQIIYSFKFFRKINVKNATLEQLDFEGFKPEKLGKEKEYNQVIDGQKYLVTEIKYALFPLRTGQITIPPARLRCDILYPASNRRRFGFDSFFDDPFFGSAYKTKTTILRTNQIDVLVRPKPSFPPGFPDTDLVGTYTIKAQLSQDRIKVGDSATLSICIEGKGNIEAIPEPDFTSMIDFKLYEDKPEVKSNISERGIEGIKTFRKAIVPLKEGTYQIPEIKIAFLNPHTGKYELRATKPINVEVLPGENQEDIYLANNSKGSLENKKEVVLLDKDIMPLKTSINCMYTDEMNWRNPIYYILLILPCGIYMLFYIYERRKIHYSVNEALNRRRKALKILRSKKKHINSLLHNNGKDFYIETSSAFKHYLSDRLNIPAGALTPLEINQKLKERNVPQRLQDEMREKLGILERGQFGSLHQTPLEKGNLLEGIEKTAKDLARWI
ncbi:MAG: BatD family protein [bacterium]